MFTHAQFLSQEGQQIIHNESVRILAEVGALFHSDKALNILEKNGAKIDRDDKIARIPAEMIEQALQTAPKSFVCGSRVPERDVHLPSAFTGYVLDDGGIFMRDFRTGERRNCSAQDDYEIMRVFDEMTMASMAWATSVQEPREPNTAEAVFSVFMNTSVHVQEELANPAEVPYIIEGLEAILGSADAVKERKLFSVVYCTLAPLAHAAHMCEAYLDLIEYEQPICIYPMPCAGSTGPASMYSNIALGNAEALSAVVLFQMAKPGCPLIYGDGPGSTNFANGGFLEGSPEMLLQAGARGEMARFYGLPNEQGGCLTDAKDHGAQAIMEKTLTMLPLVMSGVDLVQGPGALETSNLVSLEQIVVDDEIARFCKRIKDGIDMSEASNYFEDIKAVKPGGHFLTQQNTLQACRSPEFFAPGLIDRHTHEEWDELGRPDMYSKARERVEEILASPQKNPLPDDVIGKLKDIIRREDEALA